MIQVTFSSDKRISALYFALLQSGYEYYKNDRADEDIQSLQRFIGTNAFVGVSDFFASVKQSDCEVYPYWPRAAILERAAFCLSNDLQTYRDFPTFGQSIERAHNIDDLQRTEALRDWLLKFPQALGQVVQSEQFLEYYTQEIILLVRRFDDYIQSVLELQTLLSACEERFGSQIQCVKIILNPIKCVHSADYHRVMDDLVIVTGAFDKKTVLHEYLHTVLHPHVQSFAENIPNDFCIELDESYYSSGKTYAFEEYAVRRLTENVLCGNFPDDLHAFLKGLVS